MIVRGLLALLLVTLIGGTFSKVKSYESDSAVASQARTAAEWVEVEAREVPLSEADPQQSQIGAMRYQAGWALRADHSAFGGFSGMVYAGGDLIIITDAGYFVGMAWNAPALTPPVIAQIKPHPGLAGPESAKADFDAEGLTRTDAGLLISFEHNHRLEWWEMDGKYHSEVLPDTMKAGLPPNGGLEAIASDHGGALWAFAERGRDSAGNHKAWRIEGQLPGAAVQPFSVRFPRNYAPTAARFLPSGDILIAARAYSITEGSGFQLLWASAQSLREAVEKSQPLVPQNLGELRDPLTVDNFEGLEVLSVCDGTARIAILSDDNFNPLQQTLLLVFDVDLPR